MIEQFAPESKTKFESFCKIATQNFTEIDAGQAFFDGMTKRKYRDNRDSGHPFEPFEIDQPELGVRKRMSVRDDWVVIETAIYKPAR